MIRSTLTRHSTTDRIFLLITTVFKTFIGDANLARNVNASDLNVVGINWLKDIAFDHWGLGDFNGDGVVDALELNELGQNWLATNGN